MDNIGRHIHVLVNASIISWDTVKSRAATMSHIAMAPYSVLQSKNSEGSNSSIQTPGYGKKKQMNNLLPDPKLQEQLAGISVPMQTN